MQIVRKKQEMGIFDKIANAAKLVANVVTNPIDTIKTVALSPYYAAKHIVDAANSMDEIPDSMKSLLASNEGGKQIESVVVFREPVNPFVVGAVKLLTAGKISSDIRHVFEVFVLKNAEKKYVRVEKNEIVEWKELSHSEFEKMKKEKENKTLTINNETTLRQFFSTYAQKTDAKKLWMYDPVTANCQVFVYLGLLANEIPVDKGLEDFIVQQKVRAEVQNVSREIMAGVTTAANFMRRVIGADGNSWAVETQSNAQRFVDIMNEHANAHRCFRDTWEKLPPAVKRHVSNQMVIEQMEKKMRKRMRME